MSTPIRGVVFDLDGTLVDSMPLVFRAYAYALAPYRAGMTDEQLSVHLGGPPERIVQSILSEPREIADVLQRLYDFGVKNWRLIRPFDGMRDTLERLRAAGSAVAVWTGRERASTELLLEEHGLEPLVDACVCGDDFRSHKPDPEGLAHALARIGVPPEAAIFLGDHDVDVLAGAAGSVRTVLITHGRTIGEDIRGKAWRVVATPSAAYEIAIAAAAGKLQ